MFEKVNPAHPDKLCDRIAGALVDETYSICKLPRIAVEILLGHGKCHIISETSVPLPLSFVTATVRRIAGNVEVDYIEVPQDVHLAANQEQKPRCGDNGIFRGVPVTNEQLLLSTVAKTLWLYFPTDGKFLIDSGKLTLCQSNASHTEIAAIFPEATTNPLGDWTGGPNVDTGAVNRKLGSDMADSITGGGLHGKDLSKADVSINIYAWLKAQETGKPVEIVCAIGDDTVDGKPYSEIMEIARNYINACGGFEKFAEWGLV